MNPDHYVTRSLELHLFFGRIMKEHAYFLRAGFTPANPDFSQKAEFYITEFENILSQAVTLGNGIISKEVLCSGEIVTEFTSGAEKQTECFTGIPIDCEITQRTKRLNCAEAPTSRCANRRGLVQKLNRSALKLLDGLISFKEEILNCVLNCKMFTMNYPLLIEHILREAKLYRRYLTVLENRGDLAIRSMQEIENFWNRIMMEHALFIRGLLDPCEAELIGTADEFAKEFQKLLEMSCDRHEKATSLEKTTALRNFKTAGTKGICDCKIRSVILPLLADHVLRETNHYIRLLSDK